MVYVSLLWASYLSFTLDTIHWLSIIVSQLFFASIVPHSSANGVLINIISASISTAGASQTGDLAYDFKIGQLVGAMPTAQLFGQVIGSVFGAIVSSVTYRLYVSRFQIPGSFLQVPSAFLLVSTAKLVLGRGLPSGVSIFMLGFGMFFVAATILRTLYPNRWWRVFIPSGVSFAVGKSSADPCERLKSLTSMKRDISSPSIYYRTNCRRAVHVGLDSSYSLECIERRGYW